MWYALPFFDYYQIFDNSDWTTIDTYPSHIVLPLHFTRDEIHLVASYRSKNRLPVVTYRHKTTQTSITRSAQPLVGLTRQASGIDPTLLDYYRKSGAFNECRYLPIINSVHLKLLLTPMLGRLRDPPHFISSMLGDN